MKLKDARRLIKKIVQREYDVPAFREVAIETEYKFYKKMTPEQRVDYDKRLREAFDNLSKQPYTSSVTSSK